MPRSQRIFDILAGLSVLSWAVLGIRHDPVLSPVRGSVTLLHLVAGSLFLGRGELVLGPSATALWKTLPSFVCAGLAFRLAPPPPAWPSYAAALFVLGALHTAWALLALGSCFAVFPAFRGVVARGPYAWVRHPAYAGELVLLTACVLARPQWTSGLLLALALPLWGWRIQAEEELLARNEDYRRYCEQVRYRLLPGVW